MKILIILSITTLLLLTACQPQNDTTTPPTPPPTETNSVKTITVTLSQFSFTPNPITVKHGDHVQLVLTATDVPHGLNIPAFDIDSGPVTPGTTKTVEFTADKTGTFPFRCSVTCGSGHKDMKGTLIVEP